MKKYPRSEDLSAFNQRYAFFQNEDGKRFTFAPVLRPLVTLWYEKGAVKKVPSKRQAAPNGAACKIYVEKGLVQWKNQPFGVIMNL